MRLASTTGLPFGSKFKLLSKEDFLKQVPTEALKQKNQYVGAPWSATEALSQGEEGWTDNIVTCTAGAIVANPPNTQKKLRLLYHLTPSWDIPSFCQARKERIQKACLQQHNLTASLIGGTYEGEGFNRYSSASQTSFFGLKAFLEHLQVKCSLIFGHRPLPAEEDRGFSTQLYYNLHNNEHLINIHYKMPEWKKNDEDIVSREAFQNTFALIHLQPEDELWIGNQRYTAAEVNQNKLGIDPL